jgi:hypothetical protein
MHILNFRVKKFESAMLDIHDGLHSTMSYFLDAMK